MCSTGRKLEDVKAHLAFERGSSGASIMTLIGVAFANHRVDCFSVGNQTSVGEIPDPSPFYPFFKANGRSGPWC
jgi:hypothetical protein